MVCAEPPVRPDVLAAGLRHVLDHRPGDPGEGSCGATPG